MLPTRGLRLAELQLTIVGGEILKRFDTIEGVVRPSGSIPDSLKVMKRYRCGFPGDRSARNEQGIACTPGRPLSTNAGSS